MLRPQVVGDVAVVAGERPGVAARAERERGEIHPGGPALGAPLELRRLRLREQHAGVAQQRLRLLPGHGEVVRAEFEQTALRAETREREAGLASRRKRKRRSGGDVVSERRDGVECLIAVEDVDVVDDQQGGRRGQRCSRSGVDQSQAQGRGSRSAHCSSSVVFPKPAGATMVTTGASVAARRRPNSAVRATTPRRQPRRKRKRLGEAGRGVARKEMLTESGMGHPQAFRQATDTAKGARRSRATVARIPPARAPISS